MIIANHRYPTSKSLVISLPAVFASYRSYSPRKVTSKHHSPTRTYYIPYSTNHKINGETVTTILNCIGIIIATIGALSGFALIWKYCTKRYCKRKVQLPLATVHKDRNLHRDDGEICPHPRRQRFRNQRQDGILMVNTEFHIDIWIDGRWNEWDTLWEQHDWEWVSRPSGLKQRFIHILYRARYFGRLVISSDLNSSAKPAAEQSSTVQPGASCKVVSKLQRRLELIQTGRL
ncbi:hypothetical protein K440DRAFT_642533 [Wilcoxina mikolae CBS 423.85]|nr:hypothetical protein K440DRAFT_642533 [Wilcoxina mikolae CBS 423.85]